MSTEPQQLKDEIELQPPVGLNLSHRGPTILPIPLLLHKAAPRWAIFLVLGTLGPSHTALAQATAAPTFRPSDAAVFGVAAGLYFAPDIFGFEAGAPDCLPCDPASLPFVDRWSVADSRPVWSDVSTGLIYGLTAATWLDLMRDGRGGVGHVVASLQSAVLATGVTVVLKEAVGRNRPVLYTAAASQLADPADHTRSWPSGHTSTAFALATSYVLSQSPGGRSLAARASVLGAAIAVGALRVASARHFPTDVIGGAALGIGSAVLVHTIRF